MINQFNKWPQWYLSLYTSHSMLANDLKEKGLYSKQFNENCFAMDLFNIHAYIKEFKLPKWDPNLDLAAI